MSTCNMSQFQLEPSVRHALQQKQVVFTVTTGRSGTGHLASLLSEIPGVKSLHEPDPNFADVMREVQGETSKAYAFWCERKLPYVAQQQDACYIETSHLFCKGFFEPLLKLGVRPSLIFLRRCHREVAVSLYQLQTVPGVTDKGLKYYLSPEDISTIAPGSWRSLHDYQLCYWYALEIERRSRLYRKIAIDYDLRTVVVEFRDLVNGGDLRTITSMLEVPRLSSVDRLKKRILGSVFKGRYRNSKRGQKRRVKVNDIDEMEAEIEYYFARRVTQSE